jgi:hypothetical protein
MPKLDGWRSYLSYVFISGNIIDIVREGEYIPKKEYIWRC